MSVLPVCVCVCVWKYISMYDSFNCHLANEMWKHTACSRSSSNADKKKKKLAFWPLCFSVLMLPWTDTNQVPKAEETKKWKVWPDMRSFLCFLISLCYKPPPLLHASACFPLSLFHYASWLALWFLLSHLFAHEGSWTPRHTHTYTPPPVNTFQIFLRPF